MSVDTPQVEVLAVGAHPDDVELGIGGLIHKLTQSGHSVGMLDLTRGEMSTRGTVEEREAEGREAARILGVACRENAGLPDGDLANTPEQRLAVIPFIRAFRPRILIATMSGDRHPDHHAAHFLTRNAAYFSGLKRIDTGQETYRPPITYYYHPYYEDTSPQSMIVDISDHLEVKLEALRAHASQFHNPGYGGPKTLISSKRFWDTIETRAAYWGNRVGVAYGEVLCSDGPIGVSSLPGLDPNVG
ncbi:MAG: bacillithiol biosynthesis deacetylase BshB1 [Nitrospiraceae bacterium]|nr:bacillithiol biosynthesis deacetylase BshB1 [Nitrospiraceae bacterium]